MGQQSQAPTFGQDVLNGLLGSRDKHRETREAVLENAASALREVGVERVRYYAIAHETVPQLSQEDSLYLTWASYIDDADNDLLGVHIPVRGASIYRSLSDQTLAPVVESSTSSERYPWIQKLGLEGRVWVDVLVRQWRRNIGVLALDWTGDAVMLDPASLATLRLLGQILGFQLNSANPAVARKLRHDLAEIYGNPGDGEIGAALQSLRANCDIASLALFRYDWSTDQLQRQMLLAPKSSTSQFGAETYSRGQSLTGLAFEDERYRRILHFDSFYEVSPQLVNPASLAFHEETTGEVRSVAYATVGVEAPVYLIRAINHQARPRLPFVEDSELIASFAQSLSPYVDADLADVRTSSLARLQLDVTSGAPLALVVERAQHALSRVEGLQRCGVVVQRDGSEEGKPHFVWGCPERLIPEIQDSLGRHPLWAELTGTAAPALTVLRRQQSGAFGRLLQVTARESADVAVLRLRSGLTSGCIVFPVLGDAWGRHRRGTLLPASSRAFIEQVASMVAQAAEQSYIADQARGALQALSLVGHEMSEPLATTVALTGHALSLATEAAEAAKRPDLVRQMANVREQISSQTSSLDGAMRLGLLVGRQIDGIKGFRRPSHVAAIINAALGQVRSEVRQGHLPSPSSLRIPKPSGNRDDVIVIDAPLVRAALVNLIRNAVKYSVPLEGEARVEIAVNRPGAASAYVDIEVTNFGPEIPMMERESIFDAFTRGDQVPGGDSIRGMGLGLYLVKQIARAHGGNAFVKGQERLGRMENVYRTTITLRMRADLSPGPYPVERAS